ncbi:MAG: mannitol dehydrogenase family protein [Treponema sp.]|nr:mannitol dehydrogenase family protein [Treponema sp.]
MKLNNESLKEKKFWEDVDISLPDFDRQKSINAALTTPKWLHFGAGNIFRAFPAVLYQELLEKGLETAGLVVAVRYDKETIKKCFNRFDDLTLLVTLKSNGSTDKKVIASIASYLGMDCDYDTLKNIFTNPSLQMVSFTITEKGYNLINTNDEYLPEIADDLNSAPCMAKSFPGRITALCFERYAKGCFPLALVSMDNCSNNGDKLFAIIEIFAKSWIEKGFVDSAFMDYICNPKKLSFPCTMIDKITPGPDREVQKKLEELGLDDMQSTIAGKNTLIAPFVNAEETQYLVIEDSFPNGRPPLEKTGIFFTNRKTVEKVEKMKVGTCLNPIHTALAIFGCLLGYKRMNAAIKDPDLLKLAKGIGYKEGLPVVIDPQIINPKKFIDEVINVRIPNPFLPDTPQRIATDSSQKIPVRFGGTLKAYKALGKDFKELKFIPLVFAGWLRYLLGIDDNGNPFEVSPDPLYESLKSDLEGIKLGQCQIDIHNKLKPILSNSSLFGLDLYESALGSRVEEYFTQMISGTGEVRKLLSIIGEWRI